MTSDLAFRLTIDPEIEHFRPEIEYACDFISRAHFLVRTNNASLILHYGSRPPVSAVHIPNILTQYLIIKKNSGIYLDHRKFENDLGKTGNGILPDGKVESKSFSYDAIGLIFFMLSRIEERGVSKLDVYQRFPFSSAFAVKHGFYSNPLADQAALDVAKVLTSEKNPRNRTDFKVRLTHDVDRLRGYHHLLRPIRTALGHFIKRKKSKFALKLLRDSYFTGEPFRSFSRIMQNSEKKGLISQFNFMGPSRVEFDSPYALNLRSLLSKVVRTVTTRGHIVGFHPGYFTFDDPDEWRRQKEGLEEIVGNKVKMGRQHVLRFSAEITPRIWDQFGMTHDATLAFPELSGYRPGTCRTFQAYCLKERRTLNLKMGASAINDFGLFGGKYNDFTVEQALSETIETINNCRKYGGELIILFHTGWQMDSPLWKFYEQLIKKIS